jgi:hypothetical protein
MEPLGTTRNELIIVIITPKLQYESITFDCLKDARLKSQFLYMNQCVFVLKKKSPLQFFFHTSELFPVG